MKTARLSASLLILAVALAMPACKPVTISKLSPYASPTPAPSVCTGTCGQVLSSATVNLSWSVVTGQQTSYEIQMSPDGTTWTNISGASVNVPPESSNSSTVTATFTASGLVAGHTYYFQVAGANSCANPTSCPAPCQCGIFAAASAVAP